MRTPVAGAVLLLAPSLLATSLVAEATFLQASRPHGSRANDLSLGWYKKLYAWAFYLDRNLTQMDWKLYYLGQDINYTNNTLFGVKSEKKWVNGTKVNWRTHPASWIPTFEPQNTSAPKVANGTSAVAQGNDAPARETMSALSVSVTSRHNPAAGLRLMPPKAKRIQTALMHEQNRLEGMWHRVTDLKRDMNWMGVYVGSHHRLSQGRPVLAQLAPAVLLQVGGTPEKPLVRQVTSILNQTGDLWEQIRLLGHLAEATKHRVIRWRRAGRGDSKSRRRRRRRRSQS